MNFINKKYKLLEKIGEGSFGSIYKAQNIRTNEYVAIKVEKIKNQTKLLKNESTIYQYLNNNIGIPSVKWFGKDNNNYYMVINLLGQSLQSLKDKMHIFSLRLILQIGIQIINLLKTIHDKGLVHRDIKPDNFLLSTNHNDRNIYIIDFGFCKSYLIDGQHMPEKLSHNLIGSNTYASINAHNFIELSRRDDLESLGYMLIYFYLGTLVWQDISCLPKNEELNETIKYLKQCITEGNNLPPILELYMNYVRNLSFNEKPDYTFISDKFKTELEIMQKKV